ncbi:MAG TPA: hypothetical protein VFE22_10520 [Edaphobacter sp.]|nr:hypothetical protein [Edaphobacter sp.]
MKRLRAVLTILMMLASATGGVWARADAALLMEEPYGLFGGINPTGHAAIYLNNVCAETPTRLRPCRPGELGVVISRYHRVAGYDWLAIPLVPYLYAVDRVEDVPSTADSELVSQLRDSYRRRHLIDLVPDIAAGEHAGEAPKGDWTQLIGASYDRRIYGFEIETTPEADERFIAEYNDRRNQARFNLFFRNCADFSRTLLNLYYPHAIRRNFFVDFGITTPKQVARSLTKYAKRHPDLEFSTFIVPQIPGSINRSHRVNGVLESLVKSKKYVLPLAVLNPQITAGMIVAYLADGRFTPPKDSPIELVPGEVPSMEAKPPNLEDLATPAPLVSEATPPGRPQPHRHITGHLGSVSGAAQ